MWSTPAGRVASWLISVAAVTVLAFTGRSTIAASGTTRHAFRNGLFSGLIAFTLTNLTATVIVIACFDRLRHDPLQLAAFGASHEPDFRTYQTHDLLGGWIYGTAAGALLGTLSAGVGATLYRFRRR
jgi:amino acid transporter